MLLSEMNKLHIALKDFEFKTLISSLAALFGVNTMKTAVYFLRRGIDNPATLAQADIWVLRNLPRIWRKRLLVQAKRKVSDQELEALGILVGLREVLAERTRLKLRRRELAIPQGYI